MAVDKQKTSSTAQVSTARRLLLSTNVVVTICLAVAIVVVLQLIAYMTGANWDMTSTGLNSLSPATETLLRNLDQNIRLTSLYFETDREEGDQQRYRGAAQNLIDLYEATNRSKVSAEWINPLKDHDKMTQLLHRLREKPAFKEAIAAYLGPVDEYRETVDGKMRALVQDELDRITSLGASIGGFATAGALAEVENLFTTWSRQLERVREVIDTAMREENPQYSLATDELRGMYEAFRDALRSVDTYGKQVTASSSSLPAGQVSFLAEAGQRYAPLLASIEAEITKLEELGPLEFDDLVQEIGPARNAVLVETGEGARAVDFASIWPPVDPNETGMRVSFERRAFKGETKLTAAILRGTRKEQTAVVFVRYGGQPLFSAFRMTQNSPAAPFLQMKENLEDANFMIAEWDLETSMTPPELDPAPVRTVWVLLQPDQPHPAMSQGRERFGEEHRQAIRDAIGDDGRVLFVAGWHPGPGTLPAMYEYNQYLREMWGITVSSDTLLIETVNTAPGEYNVARRDFHSMRDVEASEHDIVRSLSSMRLGLPSCAPLVIREPKEDTEYFTLVTQPARNGVWGVRDLDKYGEQQRTQGYLTKIETDQEGPFDLAIAAVKGDAKAVVISSRGFARDNFALAQEMALTPHGIRFRLANPGNATLLINSLHWLNDNTEFMDIGKPIDAAVLEVEKPTIRTVQALTVFVWPILALGCGGVVWWVRRR